MSGGLEWEAGLSLREIAADANYSHQRIHQIVKGAQVGAHQPRGKVWSQMMTVSKKP